MDNFSYSEINKTVCEIYLMFALARRNNIKSPCSTSNINIRWESKHLLWYYPAKPCLLFKGNWWSKQARWVYTACYFLSSVSCIRLKLYIYWWAIKWKKYIFSLNFEFCSPHPSTWQMIISHHTRVHKILTLDTNFFSWEISKPASSSSAWI